MAESEHRRGQRIPRVHSARQAVATSFDSDDETRAADQVLQRKRRREQEEQETRDKDWWRISFMDSSSERARRLHDAWDEALELQETERVESQRRNEEADRMMARRERELQERTRACGQMRLCRATVAGDLGQILVACADGAHVNRPGKVSACQEREAFPLGIAAYHGQSEAVALLLEHGASLAGVSHGRTDYAGSAIKCAQRGGHPWLVRKLRWRRLSAHAQIVGRVVLFFKKTFDPILYQPGGSGFVHCRDDFESMVKS